MGKNKRVKGREKEKLSPVYFIFRKLMVLRLLKLSIQFLVDGLASSYYLFFEQLTLEINACDQLCCNPL